MDASPAGASAPIQRHAGQIERDLAQHVIELLAADHRAFERAGQLRSKPRRHLFKFAQRSGEGRRIGAVRRRSRLQPVILPSDHRESCIEAVRKIRLARPAPHGCASRLPTPVRAASSPRKHRGAAAAAPARRKDLVPGKRRAARLRPSRVCGPASAAPNVGKQQIG